MAERWGKKRTSNKYSRKSTKCWWFQLLEAIRTEVIGKDHLEQLDARARNRGTMRSICKGVRIVLAGCKRLMARVVKEWGNQVFLGGGRAPSGVDLKKGKRKRGGSLTGYLTKEMGKGNLDKGEGRVAGAQCSEAEEKRYKPRQKKKINKLKGNMLKDRERRGEWFH